MFNCTSLVLPTKVEAGAAVLLTPLVQWRQLSEGSLNTCRRSGMVQRLDPRSLSHQLVVSPIQVPPCSFGQKKHQDVANTKNGLRDLTR